MKKKNDIETGVEGGIKKKMLLQTDSSITNNHTLDFKRLRHFLLWYLQKIYKLKKKK